MICFSGLVCAAQTAEEEESEYMRLAGAADSVISLGDWPQAEQYLVDAMRLEPGNPTNVMLISNLAIVRFQMGNDSLALSTINQAHEMAPMSVTVLDNRARIYSAIGNIAKAYEDYSRIIELDSTLTEPRLRHGLIALHEGDVQTAEKDFTFMNRLDPDGEGTCIGWAMLYSSTSRPAQAIPYYTKLLQKSPEAEYYSGRATCYLLTRQFSDASVDIAEGMKLYPDDSEFFLLRAWLNKMCFRYDEAKEDAQRAIEMGADPQRVSQVM